MKELLGGEDAGGRKRAMGAMMGMRKLDVGGLREAYEGREGG